MIGYEEMSTKPRRFFTPVWTLLLASLLFVLTLTTVALLEAGSRDQSSLSDVFIVRRLWSSLKEVNQTSNATVVATVERIAREATNRSANNYYEEQQPVVLNAETADPILAERQDRIGPPRGRSDSYEQSSYFDDYAVDANSEYEQPYFGSQEQGSSESSAESDREGRASQGRPQDSFYRGSWQYASKPPNNNNRKLQPVPVPAQTNHASFPVYDDLYDYPMQSYRPAEQQQQQLLRPTTASKVDSALDNVQNESTLVSVLKSLKQIWDLYQALVSAWNAMHEHHQKNAEQLKKEMEEKKRLRQQLKKSRVNSKKPQRIGNDKIAQQNQTKTTKSSTTTMRPSTSTNTPSDWLTTEKAAAKVEPRKDIQDREKRASESESTDVGEGRYIKGDPLKGYYDFVITEGSYKFWAVFQVGTALLIIYSTFAAIYYSKVNPLTSDYDYTDYLGGGRSLSGGDDDFVDDSDAAAPESNSRLMGWVPRTAHSLKFILDAIDKLPLEHHSELGWKAVQSEAIKDR